MREPQWIISMNRFVVNFVMTAQPVPLFYGIDRVTKTIVADTFTFIAMVKCQH